MRREASSGVSRCGKQLTPVIILFAAAFAAALGTLGPLKSSAQGPGMSDGRDRLAATPLASEPERRNVRRSAGLRKVP
ncbi:MAG TPA: hypothetical protein DCK93_19240 [Blastocatellia bacterium]|nr:hypothetical protein [Blastocatellia bacterium]